MNKILMAAFELTVGSGQGDGLSRALSSSMTG
jgi:hypothetical protein